MKEAAMLGDRDVAATLAVSDLDAARTFYEGTLGLAVDMDMPGEGIVYKAGASRLLVYRSEFAGTNQATAASWSVGDDLESVIDALRAKGVTFEHYDLPETTRDGDIHVMGNTRGAWFKDPDGNIIALVDQ
jgi:catechol 2,3-dioxygenase-like lactoylglutathione lyase family enzyme